MVDRLTVPFIRLAPGNHETHCCNYIRGTPKTRSAATGSSERSDAELVRAARLGDRTAFATLFERHRPLLAALCRRALGDPSLVEDAVQEAALRALLGLDHLHRPEQFGPWLGGIGLNVCRMWLRRRKDDVWSRESLVGGGRSREPIAADEDPADRAEEAEVAGRVRAAVAALPAGQRVAVALYYLADLTVGEVAAQLGIAPGAVKTRLHKARAVLRVSLIDLWEERTVETTPAETVEVRVADVRRVRVGEGEEQKVQHHVILQEVDGPRALTIWMGEPEAGAVALRLEGVEFTRPLPYSLMASLLQAVGVRVREVVIARLADDVFYATIAVEGAGGAGAVDARPSDAINLALLAGAPIWVSEEVMRLAGVESVPAPADLIERGPEIAAQIVQRWQQSAPSHLPQYQSTEARNQTE